MQQWLDSLPGEDANSQETTLNLKRDEDDSDTAENKAEESITDNTVIETQNVLQEDKSLEVPEQKELWKRKSLESGVLNDKLKNKIKLQRDHSIQSEGYTPRLKNPLLRDHSLQVS